MVLIKYCNQFFTTLKELQNCILCIIPVWSLFCSVRVQKSLHVLLIHLVFVFLCFIFSCFCFFVILYLCCFALCFEFNALIDLITWHSQVIKINHVLFKFIFTLFRRFINKAVLKNSEKFTWKHLCWSLFLMKLQAFRSATLLERDSNAGVLLSLLQKF